MPQSKLNVGNKAMKKTLALVLLGLSLNANALTGVKLKEYLIDFSGNSTTGNGYLGAGYVIGVADSWSGIAICIPKVTNLEIANAVLSYLLANPEKVEKTYADVLVTQALSSKWPCKKKEGGSTPAPAPRPAPKPMPKTESPF